VMILTLPLSMMALVFLGALVLADRKPVRR
jgi:hypothetical protein